MAEDTVNTDAAAEVAASTPGPIGTGNGNMEDTVVFETLILDAPVEFILTEDWADYKKGDKVELSDKSVIEAGKAIGLFEV